MNRQIEFVKSPIRLARESQVPPLSREGLAYKAGVSVRTLERIELGHTPNPRRATLKVIADALGVTPDDLLEREAA